MKTRARIIRRDTLNALVYTVFAIAALILPQLIFGSELPATTDRLSHVIRPRSIASTTRVRIQGALTCDAGSATESKSCSLKIDNDGNTQLIQISGYLKNGIAERVIELYRTGKTTVAVEGDLSTDRRSIELSEVESI